MALYDVNVGLHHSLLDTVSFTLAVQVRTGPPGTELAFGVLTESGISELQWTQNESSRLRTTAKMAHEVREAARTAQIPEVQRDLLQLAEQFERMAAYVEKRYSEGRDKSPPDDI